jgi:hypothetical protein
VTFTATVTPGGSGTPTGTVTFLDGSTQLGSAALSGGVASLSTSALTGGTHSITASYSGDANFAGSTSPALSQTVSQDGTSAAVVSSANPSVFSQTVTFTATVSAQAPGSGTPTGTVTFKDGTTTLGTASLSNGQAMLAKSSLAVGGHGITVTYSGDANFTGSTSGTLQQTVAKDGTTTIVTSSLNPSVFGQSVTFTATVSANAPGSGKAGSGTVTFRDGNTTLAKVALRSGGTATYTTSSLAVGAHSITATYAGNKNFLTSTSATLTQQVNAAAQLVSAGPSAIPTSPGEAMIPIVGPTGVSATAPLHELDRAEPNAGQSSVASLPDHGLRYLNRTSEAVPLLDLVSALDQLFANP